MTHDAVILCGLAAPYGVANSSGGTFARGAFAETKRDTAELRGRNHADRASAQLAKPGTPAALVAAAAPCGSRRYSAGSTCSTRQNVNP